MSSFTMPETFKIPVTAECPSHARSDVKARHHQFIIDEPPARNGTDLGPSPLETMLSSYLGCTNVIANMISEEMGIKISELRMSLMGYLDTRGVFGKADVAVPFPKITLKVHLCTDADDQAMEKLKSALAKRCPVSVILRQAGCQIEEEWNVERL